MKKNNNHRDEILQTCECKRCYWTKRYKRSWKCRGALLTRHRSFHLSAPSVFFACIARAFSLHGDSSLFSTARKASTCGNVLQHLCFFYLCYVHQQLQDVYFSGIFFCILWYATKSASSLVKQAARNET